MDDHHGLCQNQTVPAKGLSLGQKMMRRDRKSWRNMLGFSGWKELGVVAYWPQVRLLLLATQTFSLSFMATEMTRSDLQISELANTNRGAIGNSHYCLHLETILSLTLPTSHTHKEIFLILPLSNLFCGLPEVSGVVQSWQQRKRSVLSWSHYLPNETVMFQGQEEEETLRTPGSSRVLCSILVQILLGRHSFQ